MAQKSSEVRSSVIPPPVMGWSTKQPISAMDPMYSPQIQNWIPKGSTVKIRKGNEVFATGMGSDGTIAEYIGLTSRFLIAFGEAGRVYNVTSGGAGTAIDNAGALTVGVEVYTCNFGGRIYMKGYTNTMDVYYWAGSGNITAAAFTGPGGDDKALWRVDSYKNRLYFLGYQTQSMWYAGDGILGSAALTEFPFANVFKLGGVPWFIGSFSLVGDSSQELFCIISQAGEVLLYQGLNPGDATWSKVGHFFIPAPVGRKAFFPWGSDIVVITYQGIISLRDAFATQNSDFYFLSDEINDEVQRLLGLGSFATGDPEICGLHYPKGDYFLINIIDETERTQLVMNTRSKAWTKFTNQNAYNWALFNNNLYFSNAGSVMKADTGSTDTDPIDPGDPATTPTRILRHAVNYFGDNRNNKQFVDARPIFKGSAAGGTISVASGVDVDYADATQTAAQTYTASSIETLYMDKLGLAGVGKAASYRIDAVTADTLELQATEIFYQQGDVS